MSGGRVVFVGCGPGAPDLLTLRAARAIAEADVVVWGRSLLPEAAVSEHARRDAEVITWPPATMADVLRAYDRARDEGLVVARLKSGDPSHFGELAEELEAVRARGVPFEVVPGVTAAAAAGAVLRAELAVRGRPLLHVHADDAGSGPAPALAVFGAGRDPRRLVDRLRAQGVPDDAPCVVATRVGWPGEAVVEGRLDEVTDLVEDLGLGGLTLVLRR